MSPLKRFSFWLPVIAVINYIGELLFNPVKDMVFAFDPLLANIIGMFNGHGFLYDNAHYNILFPGFLVHILLWLIYGVIIDYIINVVFKQNRIVH